MTITGILWYIIVGTIAGVLAKFFYRDKKGLSWFETMFLGIGGSIFGGFLGGLLGMSSGAPGGIFTATIGAILLLWIYDRVIKGRK